MSRFVFYIIVLVIYLAVSVAMRSEEEKGLYIPNSLVYSNHFRDAPLSVILVDSFATGLFVKTYYHRYHVVYGLRPSEDLIFRVSREFYRSNEGNIGMSLFSKSQAGDVITRPIPPGTVFLGDKTFGDWIINETGRRVWSFYSAYSDFPVKLGWGDFVPDYEFFQKATISLTSDGIFYGVNSEFGTDGPISKRVWLNNDRISDSFIKRIMNGSNRYFSTIF